MSSEQGEKHKFQEDSGMTFEEVFGFAYGPVFSGTIQALRDELGDDRFIEVLKRAVARHREVQGRRDAETASASDLSGFKAALGNDLPAPGLRDAARFWDHVSTSEVVEDTDRAYAFTVTECLWAKTMREMNATDIGYAILCHSDYAYCQGFNPKIRLTRTKTLMQGDDCCDLRWVLED